PLQDPQELCRLLGEIRRANRRYGGVRVVLHHLAEFIPWIPHRPITVLDVATASADIPQAVAEWARRKKLEIDITAVDLSGEILALARSGLVSYPEIALVRADALRLPFADRSFDIVISGLTLHHFTLAEGVVVLREIARVAREAFLVNDLVRSWTAYAGVWVDANVLGRGRLVKHDAPLSVLRSFTIPELQQMAALAGLNGVEVRRHRFFRAALLRRPGGA
ncbi:MAG: methyltransferase domain-containing protein, partial [bacterium]